MRWWGRWLFVRPRSLRQALLATTLLLVAILFLFGISSRGDHRDVVIRLAELSRRALRSNDSPHNAGNIMMQRLDCRAGGSQQTDITIDGLNANATSEFDRKSTPTLSTPLRVHLVFHSHLDPGWLWTFDQYMNDSVVDIMDNAINFLEQEKDGRFIWSETSFLEAWWRQATEEDRARLKRLVEDGRMELCGGAWVMTDEAIPLAAATLDNIAEGHRFVRNTFNTTIRASWSVDPFGHGFVLSRLLSGSSMKRLVIGRITSTARDQLKQRGLLHFTWKSPLQPEDADVPLVNVLPAIYTTHESCGPNMTVCCKWNVGSSARSFCSGRMTSVENATQWNIHMVDILNQYRIVQAYYNTTNILMPVGDDFYFREADDFEESFHIFSRLKRFCEENPQHKTQIHFSTVSDYFEALEEEKQSHEPAVPSLKGDFFPYIDSLNGSHPFWTGFYAHRPYHKRSERITLAAQRALDSIRIGWGGWTANWTSSEEDVQARRDLALFQHHDAITGTSRPHVMWDFLERLMSALKAMHTSTRSALAQQLGIDSEELEDVTGVVNGSMQILSSKILSLGSGESKTLLIRNTEWRPSSRVVSVLINCETPLVRRLLAGKQEGEVVNAQLSPNINSAELSLDVDQSAFVLSFHVHIPAMSIGLYRITNQDALPTSTALAKVLATRRIRLPSPFSIAEYLVDEWTIENDLRKLHFAPMGNLSAMETLKGDSNRMSVSLKYMMLRDSGGAYTITQPLSPAVKGNDGVYTIPSPLSTVMKEMPFEGSAMSISVQGPLLSESWTRFNLNFTHKISLHTGSPHPHLEFFTRFRGNFHSTLFADLRLHPSAFPSNDGTATPVTTEQNEVSKFRTDANGLILVERKYNRSLPIAGSIYPVASMAAIDVKPADGIGKQTVTLVAGQPTGATSNGPGRMLWIIDRAMPTEDGKGLGSGDAAESLPAHTRYDLVVSPFQEVDKRWPEKEVHDAASDLLYEPIVYSVLANASSRLVGRLPSSNANSRWPCEIQLLGARPLEDDRILVWLRMLPYFCKGHHREECEDGTLSDVYRSLRSFGRIYRSDFVGNVKVEQSLDDEQEFELLLRNPLHIAAFLVVADV